MADGSYSPRTPIEYQDADHDELWLTAKEAANMMRVDTATLANLRARGEGLPYYKPYGRVLYKGADVMAAVNASGRGYNRARFEDAVATWRGPLTTAQREDLIRHVQAAMWK